MAPQDTGMLHFAIIGCGHIAQRHAALIAAIGKLQAVCDADEDKAHELATTYGANAYTDTETLYANEKFIDIVVVCTPNFLHAAHTIEALKAGCHVICEKPMAINAPDCRQMIKEAANANKSLFIVKQNRFNPPVVAVKRLLDENKLGRIYSIHLNCIWNRNAAYYENSWKGTKTMDGGILYTQFSHFIDLLYWIAGDVKKVMAYTANLAHQGVIEFEDTGVACLEFENGALGSMHFSINSYQQNREGSLMIVAEKGTVKIGGRYLDKIEYQQIEDYTIENLAPGNAANDYGHYQGSMSNHDKVYEHVVDAVTNGIPNLFDGCDALRTVEIIEKIYQAANETVH